MKVIAKPQFQKRKLTSLTWDSPQFMTSSMKMKLGCALCSGASRLHLKSYIRKASAGEFKTPKKLKRPTWGHQWGVFKCMNHVFKSRARLPCVITPCSGLAGFNHTAHTKCRQQTPPTLRFPPSNHLLSRHQKTVAFRHSREMKEQKRS